LFLSSARKVEKRHIYRRFSVNFLLYLLYVSVTGQCAQQRQVTTD